MAKMKPICVCELALLLAGCSSEHFVVTCQQKMPIPKSMIEVAEDACYQGSGSVTALKPLLEQGFPINHIVNEFNQTALHIAANLNDKALVRFLLANGADKMVLDWNGYRPVDVAYAENHWGVCRLLALKPPPPDMLLEGIPEGVWKVVFREQFQSRTMDRNRFLVLNVGGKPVPDVLSKWIFEQGLNVGANNHFKDTDKETGASIWRDAMTGEEVTLCWFVFEELSDDHYRITMNSRSGPLECQRFGICEARKKYGYWLGKWIESGHIFVPGMREDE